jgi:hypothetical protein
MRMSELPSKLATALAKAQAEIKPVAKSGFNPHFRKPYSTLTDVWDAVREPLTKNGISILQMTSVNANGIVLNTLVLHSSGESVQGELPVAPVGTAPQPLGSAISYARRYALLSAVGGSVDDDDDGSAASGTAGNGAALSGGMSMGMGAAQYKPNPTPLPEGAKVAPTSPPPPVPKVLHEELPQTTKLPPKATGGGWTLAYKTPEAFAKLFKEKITKAPDMKAYEKLFMDNDANIMRLLDDNAKLHDEVIGITNQRKEALSKETI